MKKFAVILLVLSLTRIGVAYADSTNSTESQNYFFGTKSAAENLNQVLALLVGPKGDPGPAGVAGKDGLIGMDGKDGLDGLPGAPGAVGATGPQGPAGSSILAVSFTGAQGTCTSGGVKFTDGAGTITYTCNGLNGSAGATGATGPTGPAGTGSGLNGGFTYAQGALSGTCDDFIFIEPIRKFSPGGFFAFGGFNVGDTRKTLVGATTNGGVASTCLGQEVTFEFFTNLTSNPSKYSNSDHIICTSKAALSTYAIDSNGSITLSGGTAGTNNSGAFNCTSEDLNADLALADVNMKDYTDTIGFSIG